MQIYVGSKNVGDISPSSIYDLKGPSFVHLDRDMRQKLGIVAYDVFFNTMREACDWLYEKLPDAGVAGCEYDMYTGQILTMS